MNIDYLLPATPAMARKIVYLQSISNIESTADILDMANQELLTLDVVSHLLPNILKSHLTPSTLGVLQHAIDYKNRFLLGTRSFQQLVPLILMLAIVQKRQILIVEHPMKPSVECWKTKLNDLQLPFQYIEYMENWQTTLDENIDIVLVPHLALNHQVISKTRDRVLVYSQNTQYSNIQFSAMDDPLNNMFTWFLNKMELAELTVEYPQCIFGFQISEPHKSKKIKYWWKTPIVQEMLKAMYPDLNMDKVLSQQPAVQSYLLNMGFTHAHPNSMARLLGMSLSMLDD